MDRIKRTSEEQHLTSWQAYVQRGQALLEKNAVAEAIQELEYAHREAGESPLVKNILALAYLKAGRWAESAELYGALAVLDETDAMVRLNAAVSYIQMGAPELARSYLEEVIVLKPDMLKAKSLLGTVYRAMEWFDEAQQLFIEAGQHELAAQMAAKIAERAQAEAQAQEELPLLLQEHGQTDKTDDLDSLLAQEEAPAESLSDDFDAALDKLSHLGEVAPAEEHVADFSEQSVQTDIPLDSHEQPGTLSVVVLPAQPRSDAAPVARPTGSLLEEDVLPFTLTPPRTQLDEQPGSHAMNVSGPMPLWVDIPDVFESSERVFALLEDGRLFMQVQERGFARMENVLLVIGDPLIQWESKRFQGNPIDQLFGPRSNPIARIEGPSHLLLGINPSQKRTSVLLAGEDVAYFREGAVLAFGDGIQWENGRVPSALDGIHDLPLDNFWGAGELIIESPGTIWGVPVKREKRVRIELERLVGWVGSLVPQIIADESLSPGSKTRAFVEFEGEGGILISS